MFEKENSFENMLQYLEHHAKVNPNKSLYIFLEDGEDAEHRLSYAEVLKSAKIIASHLLQRTQPGDRVILTYQPGLEFIQCFWGCLYAGLIAVPVYPPSSPKDWPRFVNIVTDSDAKIICSTTQLAMMAQQGIQMTPALQGIEVLATETLSDELDVEYPVVTGDTITFLQYTSGSTGTPKGVMVTHKNLLHNSYLNFKYFTDGEEATIVCWVPQYHDMGLIGNIIAVVYANNTMVFMSPFAFLQKPVRWLKAISKYRGFGSSGPNFSYELCLRRISDEDIAGLDLSCWKVAVNSAEPIRYSTMQRFIKRFEPCGFKPEYITTAYGLAEVTLLATQREPGTLFCSETFLSESIESNKAIPCPPDHPDARWMVGSGRAHDLELRIVHPDTCNECADLEVGEIWLRGASVALGYWNKPEATEETFNACIANTGESGFLRTGDLGFLKEGELFVTGRLKEVIIIDGRNLYPQDIEDTVQKNRSVYRKGCGAAFSVDIDDEEVLVFVQEIAKGDPPDEKTLLQAALETRADIAELHRVNLHSLVLIESGTFLKTSSGKIRRRALRDQFLNNKLKVYQRFDFDSLDIPQAPDKATESQTSETMVRARYEYEKILAELIAPYLKSHVNDIDIRAPFSHFGLDSKALVGLSGELSDKIGENLEPRLFYDYPNIEELARFLSGELDDEKAVGHFAAAYHNEPIAIVGISCRFPGSGETPETFWERLISGEDAITETPERRWSNDEYYDPDPSAPGKLSTRFGGYIENERQFDAGFFSITPREAAAMDPQQRLLLEMSWKALENALINPETLRGSNTGVFIGISNVDYDRLRTRLGIESEAYAGTGNALSIAANRISYYFDFHGPSVAVDTACSSSLVAIHQACQSLRSGESGVALAGGVNLILTPDLTITFSKARMMAPDGKCKAFDDAADGYVRGEGCGMVVLKRLEDARREGDNILAIIRGSGVSQDGKSNGLTAPNGRAQERAINAALAQAELSPGDIQYIEAHGTGTALGDPIEVTALSHVFNDNPAPVRVGSAKSVIGHLEAAAGIAGVIKTVLALQNHRIPPTLNINKPNQQVDWDNINIKINDQLTDWSVDPGQKRRAGVSSFGFGGTNAHLILEEPGVIIPNQSIAAESDDSLYVFPISAKNRLALDRYVRDYVKFLETSPGKLVREICTVQALCRPHFEERATFICSDEKQLLELMNNADWKDPNTNLFVSSRKKNKKNTSTTLMFTGQGSQYLGMGNELYHKFPVFASVIDECHRLLSDLSDLSLKEYLLTTDSSQLKLKIRETQVTQPVLFCFEYALARLWFSFGLKPDFLMGHSVGEYVAAAISGVFSLADAIKLIYHRGRLMQELDEKGSMMAVFSHRDDILSYLDSFSGRGVSVGAFNGPTQVVLSGRTSELELLEKNLAKDGFETRWLDVSHGFHSPLMEPMIKAFREIAETVSYNKPKIPIISNLNGCVVEGELEHPDYWCKHILAPVHFQDGIERALENGCNQFIEAGPKLTLCRMVQRCCDDESIDIISSQSNPDNQAFAFLAALSRWYVSGGQVEWGVLYESDRKVRLAAPGYPFERKEYWLTSADMPARSYQKVQYVGDNRRFHPLLGQRLFLPHLRRDEMHFEAYLGLENPGLFADFVRGDKIFLAINSYLEMMIEAGVEAFGSRCLQIQDLYLHKDFYLKQGEERPIHTTVESIATNELRVKCYSVVGDDVRLNSDTRWILLSSATIKQADPSRRATYDFSKSIGPRVRKEIDVEYYYRSCRDGGLVYVAGAQEAVKSAKLNESELLAEITINTDKLNLEPGLYLNSTSIHALYQAIGILCEADPSTAALAGKAIRIKAETEAVNVNAFEDKKANSPIKSVSEFTPIGLRRVEFFDAPSKGAWVYLRRVAEWNTDNHYVEIDFLVLDSQGSVLVDARGLKLRASKRSQQSLLDRILESETNEQAEDLVEQHLSRILAKSIGIDAEDINTNRIITEQGIDSIIVMDFLAQIKSTLGVDIKVSSLQDNNTLSKLAAHIVLCVRGNATDEKMVEACTSVVKLQKGKPGITPVIMVHPIGGSVLCYMELAGQLGKDQPLWALQSKFDPGYLATLSIEDIASEYLRDIQREQPHGPYMLGGWSLGSVIAMEIANQLESQGETVKFVAVIDGAASIPIQNNPDSINRFLIKLIALDLRVGLEQANDLVSRYEDPAASFQELVSIAMKDPRLSDLVNSDLLMERFLIMRAHFAALQSYQSPGCHCEVNIFKAEEPLEEFQELTNALGWESCLDNITRVQTIPGDHFSILHGINVKSVGSYLRSLIKNHQCHKNRLLSGVPLESSFSSENSVIEGLNIEGDSSSFHADLRFDEKHRYFFDHPLDHIPGIMIVCGFWETCVRSTFALDAMNNQLVRTVKAFSATFNRFAEKDVPLHYSARVMSGGVNHLEIVGTAEQNGQKVCTIAITLLYEPRDVGELPSSSVSGVMVAADLVHKHVPENILIANAEHGVDTYRCIALLPASDHILVDGSEQTKHINPVYFLEASRQFVTYLSHTDFGVKLGTNVNLVSFELTLDKLPDFTDSPRLKVSTESITRQDDFTQITVDWLQNETCIGRLLVTGQVVNQEKYKLQRGFDSRD